MAINYTAGDEPVPGSGYRLSEFLGRGGFGEVWKAHGPGGVEVALKIINLGGIAGRKEFRALQLVKRIHHPGVIPIVAFWLKAADGSVLDDDLSGWEELIGRPQMSHDIKATAVAPPDLGKPQATELVIAMGLGQISLFDRMRQCQEQGRAGIAEDELLGYLESAAHAIDYLNSPIHDLGYGTAGGGPAAIQHCDIKPQNILIVGNAAQVCDFGLARMMGTERATTTAATIAYAAPECLTTGLPSDTTDQYSLAVSYYELRTGRLPYENEAPGAVMDAKLNEKLDFSQLPPAQQTVLRRATSQEPAARFGSSSEMIAALRKACEDSSAQTTFFEPDGAAGASRPQRAVLLIAVAAVLLVAVTSATVWFQDFFVPATAKPPLAAIKKPGDQKSEDQKPDTAEASPAVDYLARGTQTLDDCVARFSGKEDWPQEIPAAGEALRTAIDDFNKSLELSPDDPLAYSRRGRAYFYLKQWPAAAADLARAVALQPFAADSIRLGQAYEQLGETQAAIDAYLQAAALEPANGDAYYLLGSIYYDQEKDAEAIQHLDKAIGLYEESSKKKEVVEALKLRVVSLLAIQNVEAALSDISRIVELAPTEKGYYADICGETAVTLAKLDQFAAAVSWAEKAVELTPDEEKKKHYTQQLQEYRSHKQR